MLQSQTELSSLRLAVVSRSCPDGAAYLRMGADGAAAWVADPSFATPFGSMKEAARMALRLPAATRAFGMPLNIELEVYEASH